MGEKGKEEGLGEWSAPVWKTVWSSTSETRWSEGWKQVDAFPGRRVEVGGGMRMWVDVVYVPGGILSTS